MNNAVLQTVLSVVMAITLSGCASSPKPRNCTPGMPEPGCASMAETYDAALSSGGDRVNLFNGQQQFDTPATNPLNIQTGRHQLAGPVFHPPKPYRIGIAPWTDANGLLHSGEYVYFTTPGSWAYGPMGLPGSAAGVMGPVRPDQLGFITRDSALPDEARQAHGVVMPDRNYGPQGLQ